MTNFTIEVASEKHIPYVREILQKLQEFYDAEIIKRVEDVIFEQMRKYSAYF